MKRNWQQRCGFAETTASVIVSNLDSKRGKTATPQDLEIQSRNYWKTQWKDVHESNSYCTQKDESGPLGLKLRKSPSLIELVQLTLFAQNQHQCNSGSNTTHIINTSSTSSSSVPQEKRKATNFAASLLQIGAWQYVSRYECDLVVKCYFAKRKLVWEVLEGGLKSKIEIQWSDISSLQASFPDKKPCVLEIEVTRPPMFFKESNPQPRKHTIWQATSDFTGGQATVYRRHTLQFQEGTLQRHYHTLLHCDSRLRMLSCRQLNPPLSQSAGTFMSFAPQHTAYLAMLQAQAQAQAQPQVRAQDQGQAAILNLPLNRHYYHHYSKNDSSHKAVFELKYADIGGGFQGWDSSSSSWFPAKANHDDDEEEEQEKAAAYYGLRHYVAKWTGQQHSPF